MRRVREKVGARTTVGVAARGEGVYVKPQP